jgi:predicted AAA+ superfamily ATPase
MSFFVNHDNRKVGTLDFTQLKETQTILTRSVDGLQRRFLFERIVWKERLLGIYGPRGGGKTTLLLQRLLNENSEETLYLSADDFFVASHGLYNICRSYLREEGNILFIDEVHLVPDWSKIIKNLYDSFPHAKIRFSGSSALKIQKGKADLSRRAVFYELPGMSFREYLQLGEGRIYPPITFETLTESSMDYAQKVLSDAPILSSHKKYLDHGVYPFFLEGTENFHHKLRNVVERVLSEDIPTVSNIRGNVIQAMKSILWEIATSPPYELRINRLSSDLGISRPTAYSYIELLVVAGLLTRIFPKGEGATITRKAQKLYINNTNLARAIAGKLNQTVSIGMERECFVAHQLQASGLPIKSPQKGDLMVNGVVFEVGGPGKTRTQVSEYPNAFAVRDDSELPSKGSLPLWMFGMLY